jgi:hypothetical protein
MIMGWDELEVHNSEEPEPPVRSEEGTNFVEDESNSKENKPLENPPTNPAEEAASS